MSDLVLASGSPRRAALLQQLGLSFLVVIPDVDESRFPGECAAEYVGRMSRSKFEYVLSAAKPSLDDQKVIICADTVVVLDDEVLGKPLNREDGMEMLLRLSGRSHFVLTDVTIGKKNEPTSTFCVETKVKFRKLTLEERQDYWDSGEPQDKAGGYGIQGLGAVFVEEISGSYSSVVGLPLMETSRALFAFGIRIFRRPSE
ncbi:MAG: Maf family protein [bacterium]|nr:septum formation inhibitor Maf [Gammaproteobacteria bacterium]HIL98661.1 septum formation inhibitor Maf [Pseudomonadales bacterium]